MRLCLRFGILLGSVWLCWSLVVLLKEITERSVQLNILGLLNLIHNVCDNCIWSILNHIVFSRYRLIKDAIDIRDKPRQLRLLECTEVYLEIRVESEEYNIAVSEDMLQLFELILLNKTHYRADRIEVFRVIKYIGIIVIEYWYKDCLSLILLIQCFIIEEPI